MPNTLARDIADAVDRLDATLTLRAWRDTDADRVDPFVSALTGAHRAATSPWSHLRTPTAAELQANDYPTGPVDWQGWRLHMETPAQGIREGVDPDGRGWRNVVKAHYGYFAGTVGADGEGVDVFLGPFPESRVVWVLNQTNADGSFDEHKVLAGFIDARAAVDAYRLSYTPGWNRYGAPLRLTLDQLRWWLQWGDKSRPLSLDLVPPGEPDTMTDTTTPSTLSRVFWDSAALPAAGRTLADVLYAIRLDDAADGLLADPMTMADVLEGAERVVMDSLVIQVGRLKPKMDALLRVMEAVGAEVKPVALQLSEPVRRFGGAHVAALFELSDGQTVTVWFHNPDSTPAKLSPADTLVSWKWVLNKKDVTIVVAPESGRDLNMREVARRIMRLAAKNSAAFARANAKRAATMTEIEGLRGTLAERQAALADLHRQIEAAKVAAEDRERARAKKEAQAAIDAFVAGEDFPTPSDRPEHDAVAEVDAAFAFKATRAIKEWFAKSLDKPDYSPFVTAREMTLAARRHGAEIEWAWGGAPGGLDGSNYAGKIVVDRKVVGRVDLGDDGKAMVYVGKSGGERVKSLSGINFLYSDDDAAAMVDALFRGLAPSETAEAAFLREVKAGAHDALALGDLLDRIEASVKALADAGQLAGDVDALASEAVARWVSLDEKANG